MLVKLRKGRKLMRELIPCSDLLRKLDVLPATFQLWQNAGLVPRVRRRNAKRYYTEEEAFLITVISELSKGRLLKVGTRGLDECCRSFIKDKEGKNRFAVCKIVYRNKSLIDAEWVLSDSLETKTEKKELGLVIFLNLQDISHKMKSLIPNE